MNIVKSFDYGLIPPKDGETRRIPVAKIKTGEPYKSAARFDVARANEIYESIIIEDYDQSEPVIIDINTGFLVDGHHRLYAAIKAEIEEIPVTFKLFKTAKDGLVYIASRLKTTRHFDEKEKYYFVVNLYTNNNCLDLIGCISREMSDKKRAVIEYVSTYLGLHFTTVNKYFTVLERATDEQKNMILSGVLTLNKVYNQVSRSQKGEIKTRFKTQMDKETVFVADTEGNHQEWFLNFNSKMNYHQIGKRVYEKIKREVFGVVKKCLEGVQKKSQNAGGDKKEKGDGRRWKNID